MTTTSRTRKTVTCIAIGLVTLCSAFLNMQPAAAATGSIFFSQSAVTATKGSQVTLNIKASSSAIFNAAQIDITYDSTALEYVSYSVAGSVLGTTYDSQQTPGSAQITLFTGGGTSTSGDNLQLMSYTFKVLTASGSSVIGFAPSSALVYGNNTIGTGSNQATITVQSSTTMTPPQTTTPATPVTQQSSSSSNKSQSQSSSSSKTTTTTSNTPQAVSQASAGGSTVIPPSTDTTAPKIISASTTGFSDGAISIKVATNEPTKAVIKFGPRGALKYSVSTTDETGAYVVPLGDITKTFNQSTAYVYRIEVTDAAGNKATSQDYALIVKPVTLTLLVRDANSKVLSAHTITVNGREFTTDTNGLASVTGVIPGTVTITYQNDSAQNYTGQLTATKDAANQSFTVTPTKIIDTTNSSNTKFILPSIIFIGALVGGTILIRKSYTYKLRAANKQRHFAYPSAKNTERDSQPIAAQQANTGRPVPASPYSAGTVISPQGAAQQVPSAMPQLPSMQAVPGAVSPSAATAAVPTPTPATPQPQADTPTTVARGQST